MKRDEFEQLVSRWLDQPERADLRAEVERAAKQSPEFQSLLQEWLSLDRLIRTPAPEYVDWERFQVAVKADIDNHAVDAKFDESIRAVTSVEAAVDWARFKRHISRAIDAEQTPRVAWRTRRRYAFAGVMLATAAAVVFTITIPPTERTARVGVAHVSVQSPAVPGVGASVARVSVMPDDSKTIEAAGSASAIEQAPRVVEVFLMIEPARGAANAYEGFTPFGVN